MMTPRSWTERKRRTPTQAPRKIHSSRTGKLVMGILTLIAEFENDIRRERQMDGITSK
jgi:DNA invertase Pin-like site-specific DNA recombinase